MIGQGMPDAPAALGSGTSRMGAKRYETLDALRGVAALAVVIFHLHAFNLIADVVPHAYLAVDFFFVLSGFVVAHAYGEPLRQRMTWRVFAEKRLVRLMPLAMLGAVLGLLVLLLKWRLFPGREDPLINIVLSGALNLFMLPSFFAGNAYEHGMYPGNGPLWSLFFELAVNLIWGWLGVRLSLRQLIAVVVVAAASLTALAVAHGSTRMGVGPETFWGGAARAAFGFMLGVLIYRLRDRIRLPSKSWGPLVCVAALLVAFIGPLVGMHGKPQALAWDLAWIFIAFPLVVAYGARQTASGRIGVFLGELSYPVYVLHWPFLAVLSGMRQKVFPGLDPIVFSALAIAAIVLASWMAFKIYDEPTRRRLGRRRPIAPPPVIA